jgi:L-ribulokinase
VAASRKKPLVGQIYAGVTGRTILLPRAHQTCALGAAIAGALVAGKRVGGYHRVEDAQKAVTGLKALKFRPNKNANTTYRELFIIYSQCHDAFGTTTGKGNLHGAMKDLIAIRNRTRT